MGEQLTVIIPTWNRRELLRHCLLSLINQKQACRILVVDNGSTDATDQMVKQEFTRAGYLQLGKNLGFAKAVNIGIRETGTPYIGLLNNDTEADPAWVKEGFDAFEKYSDYWFFASRIINFRDRDLLDSAGDCYSRSGLPFKRGVGLDKMTFAQPQPIFGASAGAAFFRRELFDRVGLFDETFYMYLEDVDLSARAQLCGYRCCYLPQAIVYHIEAASDPEFSMSIRNPRKGGFYSRNRVFWISRNRWLLMMTYQPFRNAHLLAFGWLKSFFYHLFKAGYTGQFLKGIWAGLRNSGHALSKRARLKRKRVLSNRDLCRLMQKC